MAKTDLEAVTYEDGTLTYDPDMKMGVLRTLFDAANSGDLGQMMEAYTGVIESWPYDGEPSDPEAWDNLKRSQFMRLNEALMGSLAELGEG